MALGYRDDHLHLLACAAVRRSVDVRDAASMAELLGTIRQAAQERTAGEGQAAWLRAWGYDDALLAERRHPTVAELDAVTGGRPAVLHHITGHLAVVNTPAGRALGLEAGGVLVERHDVLARVPRPDRARTVIGVAGVLGDLAAAGISACTDATHTNDLAALELLADAVSIEPAVAVAAMVGADRLDTLGGHCFGMAVSGTSDSGVASGSVRIGHAKVMPAHDDDSAIADLVAAARAHGFPVAIHVMDIDTLHVALDALEAHPLPSAGAATRGAQRSAPGRSAPDRIEHCALALPEQLDRIARLGVKVVTQPSFVTRREQKYRDQLSPVEQEWLWPLAGLLRRGIEVSFSSDAPTVPADPNEWIAAATGRNMAPAERIDADTAHQLCWIA
ncbi:amidohydrolase family protein [Candidatus Poriferisodalis sp.]|uniref:amidohydrolase family protein n=1 Tax=Candidatus Poriferisodalis sp. TaxID=3101277 RepID=UPI003B027143